MHTLPPPGDPDRRAVVAAVSDLHINSTVALCPPGVELDDGGHYSPSPFQQNLWRCWLDYWRAVLMTRERHGGRLYVIINGDAVDGDHHDTPQIITRNLTIQARMALMVLQPIARLADYLFIIRGTEVHTGKSGAWEEWLAEFLHAVPDDETGTHSWWWLPLEAGGVRFDVAHHPGTSSRRPWTKGGAANRLSAWLLNDYASMGEKPPQVALRGHNHTLEDSGLNHAIRTFCMPCWQLTTGFGHRIGGSGKLADIGGLIFTCADGRYDVDVRRYPPKRRGVWRATLG